MGIYMHACNGLCPPSAISAVFNLGPEDYCCLTVNLLTLLSLLRCITLLESNLCCTYSPALSSTQRIQTRLFTFLLILTSLAVTTNPANRSRDSENSVNLLMKRQTCSFWKLTLSCCEPRSETDNIPALSAYSILTCLVY